MLELTSEECRELEKRVEQKLRSSVSSVNDTGIYEAISFAAVHATIVTIREYERMKAEKQSDSQPKY